MSQRMLLQVTALLGALAVALGAFGAHGIRKLLSENRTADTWETAVFYHFIHVAVMLAIVLRGGPSARAPWILFLFGIIAFSGSLYVLAVTKLSWLGPITPIGGVCFIAGWVWLVVRPLTPASAPTKNGDSGGR